MAIKIFLPFILIGFFFLFAGCATIYNPATQQQEFILIDTKSEVALGTRVAGEVEQKYRASKNPKFIKRVESVGEKMANVSDRIDLEYNFGVIEDKEVNAFSFPGGYVYVHTGLLERVNDNELACVIGHEIGHIAARHSVKRIQTAMGYNILMNLAFRGGKAQDLQKVVGITFDLISLGYSREDEFLADRLGVKYAYRANFDPEAMITFLHKLQELDGGKSGETGLILRTHPYISQRIEKLQEEISKLKNTTSEISPNKKVLPKQESAHKQNITPQFLSSKTNVKGHKYCPTCGKSYLNRYNFCPKDGTRLIYKQ